ncbi:unnamed protein product [Moneuplotes crassus]|uniref:Uncharacterized protein n=3 Tax=Euplotes crassus TaxID=5936 RepID=A0AAD1XN91_EUPCR|nr:unnamed protein product [Moneuplotes crassus]
MEGKLPLIMGGVSLLVGGAFLFHYLTNDDAAEEENLLSGELSEFGSVEKDANGMVKFDDFLKIFKLVTRHSKLQIANFKAKNNDKRRQFLKDGDEDGYRDCIKQQISQEETIYQEVATEVLNYLDIEEQEFMMAQQMHQMNPQFQKTMMEMQMGTEEGDDAPPKVTKEVAKEIFIYVEDEKAKSMANMKGAGGMFGNPNDAEGTINMIVEHSKVGDKLFEKYGIEEEEFAKCIQYYNLIQDPEIQKVMQKSLQNMGPEAMAMLAQMQGGAPGGAAPGGMGF